MPINRIHVTELDMQGFSRYVSRLQDLATCGQLPVPSNTKLIPHSMESQVANFLNSSRSRKSENPERSLPGQFWRKKLVSGWLPDPNKRWVVCDPTCGAGDLLVACARQLPVGIDLISTIRNWESRLSGYDLHSNFVRATPLRLLLLAMLRCNERSLEMSRRHFPKSFPRIA